MVGGEAPDLTLKLVKQSALLLNNNNLPSDSAVAFMV